MKNEYHSSIGRESCDGREGKSQAEVPAYACVVCSKEGGEELTDGK